jgi:glutamate carboxypeptidase
VTPTRWLRQHEAELHEDVADLAAIGSHASQPEGVERVARYVIERLEPIGFTFETRPQPAEPAPDWLTAIFSPGVPYETLGSTYIGRRGDGDRDLLLLVDLDTAFPPDAFARFPVRRDGDRLFGPGVADMKGGLVVLTAALRALAACEIDTAPIAMVLAGDEQAGSLGSRASIEEAARRAAWCLCMECARDGGRLMASRAHIGVGRIVAKGREAHAGSAFAEGVNAVNALARALVEVAEMSDPERGILVSATIVRGGRRRSLIPAEAEAVLDVRTPDQAAWNEVAGQLAEIIALRRRQGDIVELNLHAHRPALPWTSATDRLLEIARGAGASIGLDVQAQSSPAAGSSAFVAAAGVPTLDGMGPVGAGLMTYDEHIELGSITERAALLALLVQRLRGDVPRA